jgi:ABC-2 type transport system ATP-binding protein
MSNPVVTAEHVSKSFGAKRVLDDLSFSVERGDVIGVLGKNGAGKTTLLEIMLGFSPASSGRMRVFDHDSFALPGAAKARVGFVPQLDELIDQLTARDQLRVIGSFYSNWDDALLIKLSAAWELDLDRRVRELSIGQRQKLSILLALGHHPDLLMLDEPVASLDPIARRQFLEQIVDIAADGSRAVVFSSHIVSDIERLANKIWILKEGRLFWRGELDALKESIVRIHIRRAEPFAASFAIGDVLTQQTQGGYMTAVVGEWSDARHRHLTEQSGATVEVERLALEEIFLELHR